MVQINPESDISTEHIMQTFAKHNIETRPIWKPMHMQPVFKDAGYFGSHVAENLFDYGLCLPSGSNLVDDDRERIAEVLQRLLV